MKPETRLLDRGNPHTGFYNYAGNEDEDHRW